jgi:hypothetical protein
MKVSIGRILAGTALLILGVSLLLNHLNVEWVDSRMLWAGFCVIGGLGLAIGGVINRTNGSVFVGSWSFLFGIFWVLRLLRIIHPYDHLAGAAVFLSLGLSFAMLFILEPRRFGYILLSLLFVAFGGLFILNAVDVVAFADLAPIIHRFWPVALIVAGLYIIMRRVGRPSSS